MTSALVGCGALVGFGTAAAPSDEPDPKPRLPLGQTNVNDRWVDTQAIPGRTLFRFDTVIMNVGYGAFEGAPGSRTPCATRRPSATSTSNRSGSRPTRLSLIHI